MTLRSALYEICLWVRIGSLRTGIRSVGSSDTQIRTDVDSGTSARFGYMRRVVAVATSITTAVFRFGNIFRNRSTATGMVATLRPMTITAGFRFVGLVRMRRRHRQRIQDLRLIRFLRTNIRHYSSFCSAFATVATFRSIHHWYRIRPVVSRFWLADNTAVVVTAAITACFWFLGRSSFCFAQIKHIDSRWS